MTAACVTSSDPVTSSNLPSSPAALPRLAIVVPCRNEAESLNTLATAMVRLRAALADQYRLETVLVDDGSTDATWMLLNRFIDYFGGTANVRLVRHEQSRGLAAAISTGLAETHAEIVASLDADCTYDPLQLVPMLKLLEPGVDLVVASPHHPDGSATGVASWRLALSRTASRLYGCVMQNKLYTYTSCVRVYRRSSVIDLPLTNEGFVGIVELVWQLDRRGGKVVECPVMLTARRAGRSKMRVILTGLAHLRFLAWAAWERLLSPSRASARSAQSSRANISNRAI